MASGCIIANCKYCKDFIWEDEDWEINDKDEFYHYSCLIGNTFPDSKVDFTILKRNIESRIEGLERQQQYSAEYFADEIDKLKQMLSKFKRVN